MKIKNTEYRQFLDKGLITLVEPIHIKQGLANVSGIRGQHIKEGRALLIALYYTGGRPAEVLNMKSQDVSFDGKHYKLFMTGQVKYSLPRTILIGARREFIKELHQFSQLVAPSGLLFFHYRNEYIRRKETQHGITYQTETTKLVYYHVKKWLAGILDVVPYHLRHSRFSKLLQKGATLEEVRILKGARRLDSVLPYAHMSLNTGKKLSRIND